MNFCLHSETKPINSIENGVSTWAVLETDIRIQIILDLQGGPFAAKRVSRKAVSDYSQRQLHGFRHPACSAPTQAIAAKHINMPFANPSPQALFGCAFPTILLSMQCWPL